MEDAVTTRTRNQEIRCLRQVAKRALTRYDMRPASLHLLQHFFNTTLTVADRSGGRYVLHLLRPDPELSRKRVESELWWLDRLWDDTELKVPPIVHARDGGRVVEIDTGDGEAQLCTLFRWVSGRFYQNPSPHQLNSIGELAAQLHEHTRALAVPAWFDRPRVDSADDAIEAKIIVLAGERSALAEVVREAFVRVRAAQEELAGLPATFGLIHADIHQKNYLFDRGGPRLIDFGDCGWGHYLYDLAVTLQQLPDSPQYARQRVAFLTGYRATRNLSPRHEALIAAFMVLRELQDLEWFLRERDHPEHPHHGRELKARINRLTSMLEAQMP